MTRDPAVGSVKAGLAAPNAPRRCKEVEESRQVRRSWWVCSAPASQTPHPTRLPLRQPQDAGTIKDDERVGACVRVALRVFLEMAGSRAGFFSSTRRGVL